MGRRQHTSGSSVRAAAVVLGIAGLLAACSDDGGSAGTTTTASETTAPTAPATTTPATTSEPSTTSAATTTATTTPPETTPLTTAVPEGDDFYVPPDPLPAGSKAGDLLRARPFPTTDGSQGWQILYVSEDLDGNLTTVSGAALVPAGPAPAGRRPVLTWANGTVGMDDPCAESKKTAAGQQSQLSLLSGPALANDWVVVATDYQGIGTPGIHPYLVGGIEGRNVLDAARAVEQIPETGASEDSPVLVWGHSQGGHAAVFAGELAGTYAPDLLVKGVVAGSPPGDLTSLLSAPVDRPQQFLGFVPMILAGFEAGNPDLDLSPILTDAGQAAVASMEGKCLGEILGAFAGQSPTTLLKANPNDDPQVSQLFEENSAGRPTDVPLFVYHGDADVIVNVASSEVMAERYCEAGATINRIVYPGADHTSVIGAAAGDIQSWMRARLVGEPAPSTCT
jgi:acetyl esterase/lipase